MAPPCGRQAGRSGARSSHIVVKRKTGGAAAAHRRVANALTGAQCRQHIGNDRPKRDRGRFEIVAVRRQHPGKSAEIRPRAQERRGRSLSIERLLRAGHIFRVIIYLRRSEGLAGGA